MTRHEGLEAVLELLAAALREDTIVGTGGRAVMKWTGVDRVLLARDRLAVIINGDEKNVGLVHEHGPLSWTDEGWRCDLCGKTPVVIE